VSGDLADRNRNHSGVRMTQSDSRLAKSLIVQGAVINVQLTVNLGCTLYSRTIC
jgi:hypothetical protein